MSSSPKLAASSSLQARAAISGTHPLTTYLLHLMHLKKTNLCVSADVTTTAELVALAKEVGDSICLLKTHADIVDDWTSRTARALKKIAEEKRFLIFEDRKFGDIGNTVQKQYTSGPLSIASWAHIVNAHVFAGPAIVTSLKQASEQAAVEYSHSVSTEITAELQDGLADVDDPCSLNDHVGTLSPEESEYDQSRKNSIGLTTTISQTISPASPTTHSPPGLSQLPPPPENARALILLAEMSSENNLLTPAYTNECVSIARNNKNFVMGYIAQSPLNQEAEDNFLIMTPGVQLPPPGTDHVAGDGLGQQYKTPRKAVVDDGADIIIVGRGIYKAENPAKEAERYRKLAWEALCDRCGEPR